ncbi:FtsX-like permease family protein [Exilibacterium tricleocarpae]|uniref:FtsX-like permease family protein n=1 Tax=Exilibacterium tricleocarpae TaxID=2591008 RepID=A0A545U5A6_9GAMM|nr:ABC transporter permease [Exilibacterium tricleocarpae]TQV84655.1 FtsX-like permease family protein [Exilibacterium tricleocarpae]
MAYLYFVWRNLLRKKTRTLLTVLSIVVAFILYAALGTLNYAFSMGVDLAGADRLITIHKTSLIQQLPYSYVNKVRSVEGVADVTHATWFGGYYQDPKNQFPQFPVVAEEYFAMYDTVVLPPEQMEAWRKNRLGAVVGRSLVERFGWKVGDRVPLKALYDKKDGERVWEFVIEGIYEAREGQVVDTSTMFFHYDYFDEARAFGEGTVGWLILRVDSPEVANRVADEIDMLFANSSAETKTSTEKVFVESFAKQFGDIGAIVSAILAAVFFTMLLVAGNTMAQSVRERIPELAVMKTIGFSGASILLMVLAESILLAVAGGLTGVGLAWLFISGAQANLQAFLPGFAMPTSIVFSGALLSVALGFVTGIFPALQGMRLSIVSALGRR